MKKTMRKSALLSSVAMLIVSAIVLTSATYAWFSASDEAKVTGIDADVMATTGLLISVNNGGKWGTSFGPSDFGGAPEVFAPVSTSNGSTWVTGSYEQNQLTLTEAAAGPTGQYIKFPLWITGPVGEEVTVEIDFEGTGTQAAKVLKFALADVNGNFTKAVPAQAGDAAYDGTSYIGSVANENLTGGAFTTTESTATIATATAADYTFTLPEGVSQTNAVKYTAYLWIEGNDADCDGSLFSAAEDVKFGITFRVNLDD